MSQMQSNFEAPGKYEKVLALESDQGERQWIHVSYTLPTEHHCLEGHFDNFQLMPGAAQLGMVVDLLSEKLGRPIKIQGVRKSKFAAKWQPRTRVEIIINPSDKVDSFDTVKWLISNSNSTFSTGVLLYQ